MKAAFSLTVLLLVTTLSGCIGDSVLETPDGDDIVLGESTDDWPTYYVPAASDLPVCDETTAGRLYYVEADTNFQACTSTGWTVVDIGGEEATAVFNIAPILSVDIYELGNPWDLIDDGDGTYSGRMWVSWAAMDMDGSIAELGVDFDLDGEIDTAFVTDSGMMNPDVTEENEGAFLYPKELGNQYAQMENGGSTLCRLLVSKQVVFIAEDDDGARTYVPMMFNPVGSFNGFGAFAANQVMYSSVNIPQADLDWLTGADGGSCAAPPVFSVSDHPDTLSDDTGEGLVVVTLDDPGDWGAWGWEDDGAMDWMYDYSIDVRCATADATDPEEFYSSIQSSNDVVFSGTDINNPVVGDTWTFNDVTGSCESDYTQTYVRIEIGRGGSSVTYFDIA